MVKILTAVSGFLLSAADIDKQALLVTFDDVTDGAEACLKVIMGRCPLFNRFIIIYRI